MSAELTEQVEAILWAENHANLCGCKQWPDECITYPGGAKAIHFTVSTEDVLRVATELIVAATRRQDDAVLLDTVIGHQPGPDACACGYDAGGHGAHVIERYQSARTAAIARGRGETGGGQ